MLKLPPFLITVLSLFAKPLGTAINNGIQMASASFVVWAAAHGMESGYADTIAAGAVAVITTAIQWLCATQGVNVSIINNDPTNGLRVVKSSEAKAAGIEKADPSAPKA